MGGSGAGSVGAAVSASAGAPSTTVADVIVPVGTFGSVKKKKDHITDEHAASVLGQGHPKSRPVRIRV